MYKERNEKMQIRLPEKVAELLAKPLTIKGRKRIREAKEAHARKVKRHKEHLKEEKEEEGKSSRSPLKKLENFIIKKNKENFKKDFPQEGTHSKNFKPALKELEDYVNKKNVKYDEETKKIDSYGLGKRILKKTGRALKNHLETISDPFNKELNEKTDNVLKSIKGVEDMDKLYNVVKKRKDRSY